MKKENEEKYRKLNYFRKIRRGSNYNAYQRQNLGSIPSKIDNFIFKLPDESTKNLTATLSPTILNDENICCRNDLFKQEHKSWKNFGSGNSIELKGNALKFSVNNNIKNMKKNKSDFDSSNVDRFKTLYSNADNSTTQSLINKESVRDIDKDSINEYFENSKIISLNGLKEKNNQSKSLTNTFNKEERYDNIFYKRELINKYYPGPGDYDTEEYSINNKKKQLRYDSLFKCKSSFPLLNRNNTKYRIGPGSYNTFNIKPVKGGVFSKLKKVTPFEINPENNNVGPGWLDLPGGINIRERYRKSHVFMVEPEKEENLEKKYGIERKEVIAKNDDINKYGEFNVIPRWNERDKTKDFNNDWINTKLRCKIKEEKLKGNIVDLNGDLDIKNKNIRQDVYYWAKNVIDELNCGKEKAKKKKGVYTFSKIPKLVREDNHYPGPGYYEPEKIYKLRKGFNINSGKNWI